MFKPKGGRGHQAPYETTHSRIPQPLKAQVALLVERYHGFVAQGGDAWNPPALLDTGSGDKAVNNSEELERLRTELEWLKRDRNALDKEVNGLHAKNGDLNLEIQELKAQLADANKLVNDLQLNKPVKDLETEQSQQLEASKLVNTLEISKPINTLIPLGAWQLARRLQQKSAGYIYRIKSEVKFTPWSREHDPDGVGWRYDADAKLFYPEN